MKSVTRYLFILAAAILYGCSGGDDVETVDAEQPAAMEVEEVSQAETMEEIWASSLDPAEKAKRVQELLARQEN
ncbi:MAG: hypothetical protein HKN08_08175 [Gammaproteobacteria bacterium]|nr:hypothetical protein [Gammaproteobacteria bacterium]